MYYSTTYSSPVGRITLACDGDNLVGTWLEGQKYYGGTILKEMVEKSDIPVFDAAAKWLTDILPVKNPIFLNYLSIPRAVSSVRRYGVFYARYHMARLSPMVTLQKSCL